jgi:F-box protein 8
MGLLLDRLKHIELSNQQQHQLPSKSLNNKDYETYLKFPDLSEIPPELSLKILKNLNATDLCLAACVWSSLANDDILWQDLCKSTWGYVSIYKLKSSSSLADGEKVSIRKHSYRKIYMHLDEATLTFNVDWRKGLEYLFKFELVDDNPMEIAKFINSSKKLSSEQKQKLFKEK